MDQTALPAAVARARLSRRAWLCAAGAGVVSWLAGCAATPEARRPPRIGLVLGGGGARGFAHVGIIKALEAQGIRADVVVGTSAGSLVGALYAAGMSGLDLQKLAQGLDESTFADWALPLPGRSGVIKGEALQQYVNRVLGNRNIEQLPRKLGIVAADLQSGQPILFERGNIGMAVRASASVPGVFQPVVINGRQYVDGGLVAPVPVRYARQMGAEFVIAVNITADPASQNPSGQLGVLWQTTSIMSQTINAHELAQADVVLKPAIGHIKSSDFAARHAAILEGERAVASEQAILLSKLGQAGVPVSRSRGGAA